jgi:hypothetical protein
LCSPSLGISQSDTTLLLDFLADKGYRASLHKAQLSQVTVTYLGVQLSHDSKQLLWTESSSSGKYQLPRQRKKYFPFWGWLDTSVSGFPTIPPWQPPYIMLLRETPLNPYLLLSTPLSGAFSRPRPSTCLIPKNRSPSMSMKIKA